MRVIHRLSIASLVVLLFTVLGFAQSNQAAKTKQGSKTSAQTQSTANPSMKSGTASAEQQLKTLDDQQRQAALQGDPSFLEKHVASGFSGFDASGQPQTREQLINNRKNGNVKYDAIDPRDRKIHVYGNTAVIDHDAMIKGTINGKEISGEYRATGVWVKQGGQWKLVAFDSAPVQGTMAASKK